MPYTSASLFAARQTEEEIEDLPPVGPPGDNEHIPLDPLPQNGEDPYVKPDVNPADWDVPLK